MAHRNADDVAIKALNTPPPSLRDLRDTERLTAAQRRFLVPFAASGLQRHFYLAGGAGLTAGYLDHRSVEDLDFFSPKAVPIQPLLSMMKALPEMKSLQWLLPRDRTTFMITWSDESQVKVEYRHFPYPHICAPWALGPFYIASLADLLADKVAALTERRYELDQLDILMSLEHLEEFDLQAGIELAERKFRLIGELESTAYERMNTPLDKIPERLNRPAHARALLDAWLGSGATVAKSKAD